MKGVIEHYSITVKHDNGKARLRVVSLNGILGAIEIVKRCEGCPETAIQSLRRINKKNK